MSDKPASTTKRPCTQSPPRDPKHPRLDPPPKPQTQQPPNPVNTNTHQPISLTSNPAFETGEGDLFLSMLRQIQADLDYCFKIDPFTEKTLKRCSLWLQLAIDTRVKELRERADGETKDGKKEGCSCGKEGKGGIEQAGEDDGEKKMEKESAEEAA